MNFSSELNQSCVLYIYSVLVPVQGIRWFAQLLYNILSYLVLLTMSHFKTPPNQPGWEQEERCMHQPLTSMLPCKQPSLQTCISKAFDDSNFAPFCLYLHVFSSLPCQAIITARCFIWFVLCMYVCQVRALGWNVIRFSF